jgi:hypothetical protein
MSPVMLHNQGVEGQHEQTQETAGRVGNALRWYVLQESDLRRDTVRVVAQHETLRVIDLAPSPA